MKALYISVVALVAVVVLASGAGAAGSLPTWDTVINTPKRFQVLSQFNNEAVLDKETGLVWERSPGDTDKDGDIDFQDTLDWGEAQEHCNNDKVVGNRKGWRLPTVQELASLVDPTRSNPALPLGHPFNNMGLGNAYWSATHQSFDPTLGPVFDASRAWDVSFFDGTVTHHFKTVSFVVWCVRSGYGGPELQ